MRFPFKHTPNVQHERRVPCSVVTVVVVYLTREVESQNVLALDS
jgi:hypothetical protein